MTTPNPTSAALLGDREILLSRTFDAPRDLVWSVWTDPAHVVKWWGPAGFSTTTQHADLRPGGAWRYTMHGPDGRDYLNHITYLEVLPPERLVYKHGGDTAGAGAEPVNFQVTVTFEHVGPAQTRVTMRSTFPSPQARDFVINQYNALEGGKQHLARLAEHLAAIAPAHPPLSPPSKPFVITRVFNAPRDLVWKVWTQQDHLQRWFGPVGVAIPSCSLDLRPAGSFHYCMRSPDGTEQWGKWVFREITPPERLVFVISFADARGNTIPAPFDEPWPLEMLSRVTFADHAGIGRGTLVTVEWSALNASAAEQQVFDSGHQSMNQGWSGTFNQLAAHLAKP